MKTVYIAYKTNRLFSKDSRQVLGVCEDLGQALEVCIKKAKKEGQKLRKDEDQIFNLVTKNQTYGYKGKGEFHIGIVYMNTLF